MSTICKQCNKQLTAECIVAGHRDEQLAKPAPAGKRDWLDPTPEMLDDPLRAGAVRRDTGQLGWECPRCRAVHAPFVRSCECKP